MSPRETKFPVCINTCMYVFPSVNWSEKAKRRHTTGTGCLRRSRGGSGMDSRKELKRSPESTRQIRPRLV